MLPCSTPVPGCGDAAAPAFAPFQRDAISLPLPCVATRGVHPCGCTVVRSTQIPPPIYPCAPNSPKKHSFGCSSGPRGAPVKKKVGPPSGTWCSHVKAKKPVQVGATPVQGLPHMVGGLHKLALGMRVVNNAPPWEGSTGSVAACPGARPHFFVETPSPYVPEGGPTFFFWVAPLSPIRLPPIVLETRFVSHGYF